MKKLFILTLLVIYLIPCFGQDHEVVIQPNQEIKIAKVYDELTQQTLYEFTSYNYGYWAEQVQNDPPKNKWYNAHTALKFNLPSLPTGAYNISVKLEAYRGSYSAGDSRVVEVPDNLLFYDYDDIWYYAEIGNEYFVVDRSSGQLHDITSLYQSKIGQGYINFGIRQYQSGGYEKGYVNMYMHIYYDLPVTITAQNNFPGGKIYVDSEEKDAPWLFTKIVGETATLKAKEQNDNLGYPRIWNDIEAPLNKSKWLKNGADVGSMIEKSFVVAPSDDGKTYEAGLRKNYRIDQTHNSEFDGSQTQQNTSYIVEQNNGNIIAPSTKLFNGKNYSFAYWTDGITGNTRNVTPTDNTTYTAFYKYPSHSSTSLGYDKDGQRKVVNGIGAYDGGVWKVYESSGNIWLEKDGVVVNGGAPVNILSDGPEAKSPSMDYVISSTWYTDIFLVYQQKTANGKYKIKLVKFNGSGQKIYTYDVLTSTIDYSVFDATPVISVTRNPDQANSKTKFNIVWRQKAEGSFQNGLYFMPGMDNGTNITWYYLPPTKVNSTDLQSSNPTMAAFKSPHGAAFLYHLAWQQGTSKINYRAIADNWNGSASGGVTEIGILEEPSYGDGYNLNTQPSIAVLNIGISNDYGVYYYDTPKLVWKTEFESVNHIGKTNSGSKGRWQTFYKYYTCDDIPSANIGASVNEQSYVIAWSELGGIFNRLIQSTNLGTQMITGTQGKDIQISNYDYLEWGNVLLNVFNNAYNTSAPFAFQNYYLTNELNKSNNFIAKVGRFGTVMKDDAEFYFGIGDVTVNNNLVNFVAVNDTLELATKELLNSYLITEPFEVDDNCGLTYSIIYGVKDSLSALANLTNTENIGFKVELIDNTSNVVLGEFDQVIQSKNNIVAYENLSYQVNTAGIGNRTVRIRLVVDPNFNDAKYSLSKIFSDGAPFSKSKFNEVNWNGSLSVESYGMEQNYPNPFNPNTTIKFQLPADGFVTLKVYDILGNEVTTLVNEQKVAGKYEVNFSASSLASGVYIYKIQAGSFNSSKKMILIK